MVIMTDGLCKYEGWKAFEDTDFDFEGAILLQ